MDKATREEKRPNEDCIYNARKIIALLRQLNIELGNGGVTKETIKALKAYPY